MTSCKASRQQQHILLVKGCADISNSQPPINNTTQPSNSTDKYIREFQDRGFAQPEILSALTYQSCNVVALADLISQQHKPQISTSLIVTSKNSFTTLEKAINLLEKKTLNVQNILDSRVYVVGEGCGHEARRLGFTEIRGEKCGCSEVLAPYIVKDLESNSKSNETDNTRVIFLHGNKFMDTIPKVFESYYGKLMLDFLDMKVYDISSCKYMQQNLQDAVQRLLGDEGTSDELGEINCDKKRSLIVYFFSPSGVKALLPYMKMLSSLFSLKFGAIGNTTATVLQKHSLPVDMVSQAPNSVAVVQSVINSVHHAGGDK